jgi:outer membrane protein assembly factor BamA
MPVAKCIAYLLIILFTPVAAAVAQDYYPLYIHFVDKDTTAKAESFGINTRFKNREECYQYTNTLHDILRTKGFQNASVDSVRIDSTMAEAWVYIGEVQPAFRLKVSQADKALLDNIGWYPAREKEQKWNTVRLEAWKEKLLSYLEENGYPFAAVKVDSLVWDSSGVDGKLVVDKGPLYKIDSIRISGKAKLKNYFLQRYLDIMQGSIYKKSKLDQVSARLLELPYVKESRKWDLSMLGTGSTLNLYLEPKKSSQINVLVGFLPDNSQLNGKLLLTGEADIHLKNALGAGETIIANWQQLQIKSPRLKLAYQHPYIFKSSLGLDFAFDLFKKDSSFLNIDFTIGVQYLVSAKQTGKVFFRNLTTNLLTIDTNYIKQTKSLPQYLDVTSRNIGVEYQLFNTDYRFNPRKGIEFWIQVSGGQRSIKRNQQISDLGKGGSDGFDYNTLYDTFPAKNYVLTLRANGSQFIKIGKQSTLKTAVNAGWLQTENVFKNELFQIGGYRLLRGFDEQSIYASRYVVGTLEYRYLIGLNSFLFGFTDLGWAAGNSFTEQEQHGYMGFGLGLTFETKAGLFNLTYAVGKRDDLPLSFRQSKIHFGFVSLF